MNSFYFPVYLLYWTVLKNGMVFPGPIPSPDSPYSRGYEATFIWMAGITISQSGKCHGCVLAYALPGRFLRITGIANDCNKYVNEGLAIFARAVMDLCPQIPQTHGIVISAQTDTEIAG